MSLQVLTTSSASQITALIDRNHRSVLPDKFHRRWYFNHLKQTKHFDALYRLLSALPLIHSNLLLCQDHHNGQCLGSQVKQLLRNLTTLYSHIGSWKARIEINLFNAITTASEPEVDKLLQSTINELSHSPEVFSKLDFLRIRNFRRLGLGQWLDDEILNYFVDKWCFKENHSRSLPTLGLSSFFAPKVLFEDARCSVSKRFLTEQDIITAIRWCRAAERKLKVTNWDCIFFPINESNSHWYSVCINYPQQKINIYDSLRVNCIQNRQKPLEFRKNTGLMLLLMRLTEAFGQLRGHQINLRNNVTTEWKCDPHTKVTFQPNDYDCGMHTLWHLKHILNYGSVQSNCQLTDLVLSGKQMAVNRLRLALEITEDCGIQNDMKDIL